VALELGQLSLVRITEELLEWRSSGSGSRKSRLTAVGICCADHARYELNFYIVFRRNSVFKGLRVVLQQFDRS
jgi:hypothetical protein